MQKMVTIIVSIVALLVGCGEPLSQERDGIADQQVDNISIATIYKRCAGCHGKYGEKKALGKSEIIGGENKATLLDKLREYKAGQLDQYGMGQLMKGQVTTYSDSELKYLATYISKLSGD